MYDIISLVSVGCCADGNEHGAVWKTDTAVTVKDCYTESATTIRISFTRNNARCPASSAM
jgi:hypothetical protein